MSNSSEYLNYDETKRVMGELNEIFADYYELLTKMDTNIESSFNAGTESALSSKLGSNFLTNWNSAAASFENFKGKFDNYYAKVMKVTENNQEMETTQTQLMYGVNDVDEEITML